MTDDPTATLLSAEPQLFVTDLPAACGYFTEKLGFRVAYLYGEPPFYGQVARDGAALNLRHVDALPIDPARRDREDFLAATVMVDDIEALYREFGAAGALFHQELREEPWGATTFIVADPDGNLILFT